jgi:hypothetical protein
MPNRQCEIDDVGRAINFRIVSVITLIIKAILVLMFIFILFAIGSALYFLVHDRENSDRIVKALTWRIGLSLLLFVFLMFAFYMGWITPNNI